MSDEGVELGVDLYHLLQAGQDYVPSVANIFGEVSGRLTGALSQLSGVLSSRGGDFPGGSPGPVYAPWHDCQTTLQAAAHTTDVIMRDTGAALVRLVHAYEQLDHAAAEELKRQCTDWGTPTETKIP